MKKLSPSLEDYLETFHILEQQGPVHVTDIANELGLSKPSVNRAVKTLAQDGLCDHEPYGTIRLTEEGSHIASEVLFRHVTIKGFLIQQLGISEKVAEEDACRMEHVVSAETMEKLIAYIKKSQDQ